LCFIEKRHGINEYQVRKWLLKFGQGKPLNEKVGCPNCLGLEVKPLITAALVEARKNRKPFSMMVMKRLRLLANVGQTNLRKYSSH
jgi:hypothetical protein